jgi:hypothetical protein
MQLQLIFSDSLLEDEYTSRRWSCTRQFYLHLSARYNLESVSLSLYRGEHARSVEAIATSEDRKDVELLEFKGTRGERTKYLA